MILTSSIGVTRNLVQTPLGEESQSLGILPVMPNSSKYDGNVVGPFQLPSITPITMHQGPPNIVFQLRTHYHCKDNMESLQSQLFFIDRTCASFLRIGR